MCFYLEAETGANVMHPFRDACVDVVQRIVACRICDLGIRHMGRISDEMLRLPDWIGLDWKGFRLCGEVASHPDAASINRS